MVVAEEDLMSVSSRANNTAPREKTAERRPFCSAWRDTGQGQWRQVEQEMTLSSSRPSSFRWRRRTSCSGSWIVRWSRQGCYWWRSWSPRLQRAMGPCEAPGGPHLLNGAPVDFYVLLMDGRPMNHRQPGLGRGLPWRLGTGVGWMPHRRMMNYATTWLEPEGSTVS